MFFRSDPGPDSLQLCLEPPDELNWVREHRHYGFPDCFGAAGACVDLGDACTTPPCSGTECEFDGGCVDSMVAPIRQLDPHSSSDGLCFGAGFTGYTADDVFIAQFGQTEAVPGCPTDFAVGRGCTTRPAWTAVRSSISPPALPTAGGGVGRTTRSCPTSPGLITRIAAVSGDRRGGPAHGGRRSPAAFD